ncbi:hypothetical protein NQ315_015566 [Exocentrus adspersus]|uniref:UDP-glucuronosyltransferase n=1 Tax=Exocentrus adspersus TaxID=1586481 RepID=A0AAV8V9F0_9CUCU|nr:hypothetical protein NQ315_015566 [Exocentrus adspersus]
MNAFLAFLAAVPILNIECARILGVIPVASYSHQVPFQPLWKELSLREHQVTLMTTNPVKNTSLTNLTEIDLSFTYEIYDKYNFTGIISDDSKSFMEMFKTIKVMLEEAGDYQFQHPQVQNLIHNKEVTFDLVIVEAQLPGMMTFSWRFNCPMIGITSLDSGMQYHLAMGNPVHPILNPDYNLPMEDPEDMSFKDRVVSLLYYLGYSFVMYHRTYPEVQKKQRKIFGNDVPHPSTLHDNMAMLFINTHPIFHSIRPLNPNTIPIGGGIHLKDPEPLPKDIQRYLDTASEGAIFFSLGTNVNERMVENIMPRVLEALGEVPYKVLLRTDKKLKNVPENVLVKKWVPQQDILRHPNLKGFITQGGLQSLQEAVYNGVPLIGIPFLGDQVANVNRMVKKGYGIKLNKKDITKESLKEAVMELMTNPAYREKAEELRDIYRDEEVPSLQRAIWWTEYVIRHKGARHLRNPVVDMPHWKYFMLDVFVFVLALLSLLVFMCFRIIKTICKLFSVRPDHKLKTQ